MLAPPTRIHLCSRCATLLQLLPALSCCHSVLDASKVPHSTTSCACSPHLRSCNSFPREVPMLSDIHSQGFFRLLPLLLCRQFHEVQPGGASSALAWHMGRVLPKNSKGESICTAVSSHASATAFHNMKLRVQTHVPLKSCLV